MQQDGAVLWGTLGPLAGILAAVLLFGLALWLVARARRGNRKVREARDDPHVREGGGRRDGAELAREDRRDISQ
jgi:hypothetical protein